MNRVRPTLYLRIVFLTSVVALAIVFAGQGQASAARHTGFGFNGNVGGAVFLTGGGSFVPGSDFIKSAGGFRCTADITKGPLAGCLAGEGTHWDAEELLPSSGFKCVGSESLKTAFTSDRTAVFQADFYLAGHGHEESFSAAVFVSKDDLDPDIDGTQNIWIAGVGCGAATVNFSS
jgi:hypothetical protein